MASIPNFFLIGAPKCGTSAMRYYLSQHPNIYFSVPDEPGFFDRRFRYSKLTDCAYSSVNEYLSVYNKADPEVHSAVGEGSVYMMYSAEIIADILSISPNARFLVMIRNPFEASVSMHGENLKSRGIGREPYPDFNDAWNDLNNRETTEISGVHPMRFRYNILYQYSKHIAMLQNMLSKDSLKIVLYDDFVKNNLEVAQEVYAFLNVSSDFIPKIQMTNIRSQAKNNVIAHFVAWAAKQSRNYRALRPLRGRGLTLNRFTQQKLGKPVISTAVSQSMHQTFREDILKLQDLTGLDISHWLRSTGNNVEP